MTKVYSAVKLPEVAQKLFEDAGIELDMFDVLDTPSEAEMIEGVKDADALISGVNVPVTEAVIEANPNLKVIANVGAGFNNIAVDKANELGIPVTNTPTHDSLSSTAELALGLMLAVSRRIIPGHKIGEADAYPGWQAMGYTGGHQVTGKTMVIWGFGGIGRIIGKYAKALEMDLLYIGHNDAPKEYTDEFGGRRVSKEEGLKEADYLFLQMNYRPENHHLMSTDEFKLMKDSAYLINTSRGGIVDEEALADALEAGELAGAGIDVHEEEPKINQRLAHMENVVITPHTGNDTYEARDEMSTVAADQAVKGVNGEELDYVVNEPK